MNAYIISIGDELLIGQTTNTNAVFIGDKLSEININVIKIVAVADNEESIMDEFKLGIEKVIL